MRTFGIPSPLFDKAADPADGGSGGGAQVTLSEEQKKEIGALISGAFKSEGKRLVASSVKEALAELKLGETIAAEVAKLKPTEPEGKPEKGEGKPDPKISALESKLAEVTKKFETEAAERQKAVEEGRAKDAKAALRSALTPLVRPDALDIAVRDLFDAQKIVTLDEQGNPLIKVRRKDYAGADEVVDMPLSDGIGHWIKTNEGKFFAPPPSGGGDQKGGRGPQRGATPLGRDGLPNYEQPATTDAEKLRRAEERQVAYLARMNTT